MSASVSNIYREQTPLEYPQSPSRGVEEACYGQTHCSNTGLDAVVCWMSCPCCCRWLAHDRTQHRTALGHATRGEGAAGAHSQMRGAHSSASRRAAAHCASPGQLGDAKHNTPIPDEGVIHWYDSAHVRDVPSPAYAALFCSLAVASNVCRGI